jgi:stress response protein YsnF
VHVEHVATGREIDEVPPSRERADTIIIPFVSEVMVVEKRFVLREEMRITRTRSVDAFEQPVTLRTMVAEVERRESSRVSDPDVDEKRRS